MASCKKLQVEVRMGYGWSPYVPHPSAPVLIMVGTDGLYSLRRARPYVPEYPPYVLNLQKKAYVQDFAC